MKDRWLYLGIAVAAAGVGFGLWSLGRPASSSSRPAASAPTIGPAALYATSFVDAYGKPQALGQFQGRPLLINFWATWCAPCREEMPVLARAARQPGGISVVGLSNETPEVVRRFEQGNPVGYPLWTGGEGVDALRFRLGDTAEVLPYSVIIGADGRVLEQRVGPYTQVELHAKLRELRITVQ